jgi:hypothetical protein
MRMRRTSLSLIIVGFLFIGLFTVATPAGSADTPGIWKFTGSMATSRRHAAMARLPDGRILVVGGTDTTGVNGTAKTFYSTAEIYNPATGTWTATGSLKTGARALHTLSLMWGGRTLITGGWNGKAALSSAEIYDQSKGTFSATGSMKYARSQHRATMLFDGRILITGGLDSSGNPIASAEIYNPATGTFSETKGGPMATARYAHRMSTVSDGKILITGGFGAGGAALATCELFDPDPASETFSPAISLGHVRGNHSATELPTGEVLIAGGNDGSGVLDSTELYDPDTNTFRPGPRPTLNQARQSHSAWVIPNGLVLISGGNNDPSIDWDIQMSFLSSAELYDLATDTFTTTGSKNTATSGGTTHPLWTGKLLSAGGGTNEAELYTPEMPGTLESWVATGGMNTARTNSTWYLLDDGRALIVGGLDSAGNPLASAELYDYLTGNFSLTGSMSTPRQHHHGTALYTGKILVTGGRPSASANVLNSAELYNPVNETFTSTGDMLRYRRLHRATPLPDGKVLITGGLGGTSNTANGFLSAAEIYDPATGIFAWTTGGPAAGLNTARYNHQAILLYTGKVLIVGGVGSGAPSNVVLQSAELYDPATGTFTQTGDMKTARNSPLLTPLPNGKVLVSNGHDSATASVGTPIQTIEIYDPTTGEFTEAGNTLVARYGNRVTRLDSGKTIFVGGQTTADPPVVTNSAELYNHVTGTFSYTDDLITGRRNFAQWSLPNGRILVAGGYDAGGTALSSAELYTPLIADDIDTTITSSPAALTNSTSADFAFTSTPPGSTFECSLDNAAFAACTSPKSYSKLKAASHQFRVRATSGGIIDPTPAIFDWKIDTKAPNTSITASPSKLTNNPQATFSFTSTEAGSAFECSLDGGAFAACASPWTSAPLADGIHTFQVRAIDPAGNADKSAAKAKKWTVDTTPPVTTIVTKVTNPTTSTSAKFQFKASEKKCTFQCNLDGAGFTPCKSSQSYIGLLPGDHNLQVLATDAAGNIELTPASFNWTIQ